MVKLSFVIPCYNSHQTIGLVVSEINNIMSKNELYSYEIILVNDSSTDSTLVIIAELAKGNSKIKVIDFAKNFGQHSALMAGYIFADGDIVVSLDDDGQTPAGEVFKLINELNNGNDVVFAKYKEKKHNYIRNIGSKINDLMTVFLLNKPKSLYLSSYFVAKSFVIKEIIEYKNPYPYIAGLILRTTNKIGNVEINHRDRKIGKSNYTFKKLLKLWLNGFTAFSVKPLRLATILGILCAFAGFAYGIWIVFSKIFMSSNVVLGYSSLMASILFIGGMIMVMLGLIGEYVGRIYISMNNSPQYVVRKTINVNSNEEN